MKRLQRSNFVHLNTECLDCERHFLPTLFAVDVKNYTLNVRKASLPKVEGCELRRHVFVRGK